MPRRWFWIFALLILACSIPTDLMSAGGITINRVDNIDELFARIRQCWQPPKLPEGHPGMQITVLFMLTRTGEIFGKPKITLSHLRQPKPRAFFTEPRSWRHCNAAHRCHLPMAWAAPPRENQSASGWTTAETYPNP